MAVRKAEFTIIKPPKGSRGNYYYREASDPKRTKHTTGQRTLRGAEAFLEQLQADRAEARVAFVPLTFGNYSERFFGKDCPYLLRKKQEGRPVNPKTVADFKAYLRNYLAPEFGDVELTAISAQQVRAWREKILRGELKVASMVRRVGKPPTARTLNYVVGCFRVIMEQADEDGLILRDPLLRVKNLPFAKESPHDALTEEEMKKLFGDKARLKTIWGDTHNFALFSLLFGSGLRSGEIRALQWGDVDFERGGLLLQRAVKADGTIGVPKNKKARAIALPQPIVEYLKVWKFEYGDSEAGDLVFPGATLRTARSRSAILMVFKRALKACGIHRTGSALKLVVHSSRHTWNTLLADEDGGILARSVLGHSSPEMTALYNHTTLVKELDKMRQNDGIKINGAWDRVLGN